MQLLLVVRSASSSPPGSHDAATFEEVRHQEDPDIGGMQEASPPPERREGPGWSAAALGARGTTATNHREMPGRRHQQNPLDRQQADEEVRAQGHEDDGRNRQRWARPRARRKGLHLHSTRMGCRSRTKGGPAPGPGTPPAGHWIAKRMRWAQTAAPRENKVRPRPAATQQRCVCM